MNSTEITLRVTNAIGDVAAEAWNACANPASNGASAPYYNPFVCHDFLSALELSGSARGRTGWQKAPGNSSAPFLAMQNRTHKANMFSITVGPMPTSAQAGITTPNFRSR